MTTLPQAHAVAAFMAALNSSDLPQPHADADAGFRFRSALTAAEYLDRRGKLAKGKPAKLIPSHAIAQAFACDLPALTVDRL